MVTQIIINGLLKGGLYALMAMGMSLIWGVMNIINIAHGSFIMLGAYTTYWLFTGLGLDPFVSLPLSMAIIFLLGWLIQKYLINLVVQADIFITLLLTFGIELLIDNLALLFWTADIRKVQVGYGAANFQFLSATIPYVRLAAFILALFISAILFWLMNRTRLGRAIRATSQELDAAKLGGVKVGSIYASTFAIGTSLAAAAGTLWSILFPISPTMGGILTLKSFVVTIIGGLGTMLGPLVGGLILGIAEALGTNWFGATYENLISFVIFLVVIIFMPKGILGARR
ncbi:MAG: branched-chain amino acid ABC transporter permease [Desulfobacterales bacterium]